MCFQNNLQLKKIIKSVDREIRKKELEMSSFFYCKSTREL